MTADSNSAPVTVTIPSLGCIQGSINDGIASFRNVPFGTILERWRHAVPVQPWEGVRDGTVQGPMCPQQHSPALFDKLLNRTTEQVLATHASLTFDEKHCLNFNIFAPASSVLSQDNENKIPVMVWLHGGSLRNGGNGMALYDASNFVKRSIELNDPVMVVTMNYRLHYLGFLSSSELMADNLASGDEAGMIGNWGLTDQKLGFQWLRSHIQAFGGNNKNLIAFGQSGGAVCLGYHMVIKSHHGLFDKVILESGTHATMPAGTVKQIQSYFDHLCQSVLTEDENKTLVGAEKVEALRKVSIEAIEQELSKPVAGFNMFFPTLDGPMIDHNIRVTMSDSSKYDPNLIRIIAGSTKDEGSLFATFFGGPTLPKWAMLKSRLVGPLLDHDKSRRDLHELFDKCYGIPQADIQALMASSQLVADASFRYPLFATTNALRKQSFHPKLSSSTSLSSKHWPRVTTYQWNRELEVVAKTSQQPLGVHHGVEAPFVFGSDRVLGILNEREKELSRQVQEIWIRFATGTASAGSQFENMGNDESIVFGKDCVVSTTLTPNISEDKVKLWTAINEYVQSEIDAGNLEVGLPTYRALA